MSDSGNVSALPVRSKWTHWPSARTWRARVRDIRSLPSLSGLPTSELFALRSASAFVQLPDKTHATLSAPPFNRHVSLPLSGIFRIVAPVSAKRRLPLSRFGRGECFGLHPLLGLPIERDLTILAERGGDIVCIEFSAFDGVLGKYPALMHSLAIDLGRRLQAANERIYETAALPARYRVAAALLRWSALGLRFGQTIVLDPAPSDSDLATDVGTSRHAVSKELGALVKERIIQHERLTNRIVIADILALQRRVFRKLYGP